MTMFQISCFSMMVVAIIMVCFHLWKIYRPYLLYYLLRNVYKFPNLYSSLIVAIATDNEIEKIRKLSLEFTKQTIITVKQRMKMLEKDSEEYHHLEEFKTYLEGIIDDSDKLEK